jgi:Mn-dependent DtxR family transcriptional regulator
MVDIVLSVRDADYLTVVAVNGGRVTLKDVTAALGVAKPTACLMLKKLSTLGLVKKMGNYYIITEIGKAEACELFWRHGVTEWMLVRSGLPSHEACKVARMIELYIPRDALEKIWEALGRPASCPCGRNMLKWSTTCRPVGTS